MHLPDGGPAFFTPTDEDRERWKDWTICLSVPSGAFDVSVRFTAAVANMIAYSHHYGLRIYAYHYTERQVVDWARINLGRNVLDQVCPYTGKGYTHTLWIDDDQVFNPDMACRLAARGDLDMISAVYYQKAPPHYPCVFVRTEDKENKYSHYPMVEIPPMIVEVDAVGFGALLMRREVLERTAKPWFALDNRKGEDMVFCVRAKEAGFRVWVAGDYQIGHLGRPPVITAREFLDFQKEHPEKFSNKVRLHQALAPEIAIASAA